MVSQKYKIRPSIYDTRTIFINCKISEQILIILTITILNRYSPYRPHNIFLTHCYIIS